MLVVESHERIPTTALLNFNNITVDLFASLTYYPYTMYDSYSHSLPACLTFISPRSSCRRCETRQYIYIGLYTDKKRKCEDIESR